MGCKQYHIKIAIQKKEIINALLQLLIHNKTEKNFYSLQSKRKETYKITNHTQ